ncbi:MAG: ATPase domain-containing protein [Candidatus Bathyarchaeota archaeon]|jgi:predicted hydrocarbon binding protein/archaellum biogenesis ATPase FlaH
MKGYSLVSIAQLQEIPPQNMILLVGPPGSGKSTFCQNAVLQNLAIEKPAVYVTTKYDPSRIEESFREKGLAKIELNLLGFVDAYSETAGLSVSDRFDTITADCEDLSSIGIAISKINERIGKKGVLLVFDSLTSPYLFSGSEILRFMSRTLSGFAAKGNSVLACMDEGCGKEEDIGAMMSVSNGVLKMEVKEGKIMLNVMKHPYVERTTLEVPTTKVLEKLYDAKFWDPEIVRKWVGALQSGDMEDARKQLSVNLFWPNLMRWSGMLWDPKRLPRIAYKAWKEYGIMTKEMIPFFPWYIRLYFKIYMPKNFSKPKDMKKLVKFYGGMMGKKGRRDCIIEYLDKVSKIDEHHIRLYESFECWGFENVNTTMASLIPSTVAGTCIGLEKEEREWNAIETKCIGLGDPYCEFKLVPGKIDDLRDSLEKDISSIERIHENLMNRLTGHLLEGKPLVENRSLGSDYFMGVSETSLSSIAGERYEMAYRMGGVRVGREVGQCLINAGMGKDKAVKCIIDFLNDSKVGDVMMDETIRIKNNCETRWTLIYKIKRDQSSCFFTTGFLNGFFSAVKNQHVKETKCVAMGDPYCEWEFR